MYLYIPLRGMAMGFGTEAGHAERVEVLVHRVRRIRDIRNARVTIDWMGTAGRCRQMRKEARLEPGILFSSAWRNML